MKKDITPEDSIVPVYLEEMSDKQIKADEIEKARLKIEAEEKVSAKSALLEKLGISEDEARLLLS